MRIILVDEAKTHTDGILTATGWALLGTFTPSAVAAVNISNMITTSHVDYKIVGQLTVANDSDSLRMQVSNNNGTSWKTSTVYDNTFHGTTMATSPATELEGVQATVCTLFSDLGNATNESLDFELNLIDPFDSTKGPEPTRWWWSSCGFEADANAWKFMNGGCAHTENGNATKINAIKIYSISGTITGTIKVYGNRAA